MPSGEASPTRAPSSPRGGGATSPSPRFEAPQRQHGPTWENTYIVKPEDYEKHVKFNRSAVSAVILQKLSNRLEGAEYNAHTAHAVANELSTSIKDGVKSLGLHHGRYKLAVHVTLGQRGGQAMRLASRCLWDTTTDNFVSETYENDSVFATAQVFALYFE